MNNKTEYKELIAFHPGYYIADMIEELEISQEEFAARMGTTGKTISKLVNGQSNLTKELAQKLSNMFGTSVDVWLNLQTKYDEKILEIERKKEVDEQADIMKLIDYSYFVKVAGLPMTRSVEEKISNLCSYLMVSDLRVFGKSNLLVCFRTGISNVKPKNIINAQIWVQTALNFAKKLEVNKFDADKLRKSLPAIRDLTVEQPNEFLPKLERIFLGCGVSFVLLPHLKNSGVNGAVKWYGQGHVLLAINDRRCFSDVFWFSLFHEIGHVLQQKVKKVFISSDIKDMGTVDTVLERDADEFAQNYLVPKKEYDKLIKSKFISDDQIVEFSGKIGIHPGIVAGRLQHDGIIPQNRCATVLTHTTDRSTLIP